MTAEAIEPDPYELALAFINNVRQRMGRPTLAQFDHASDLGKNVIRHGGQGPLYVMCSEQKDAKLIEVLVELGCRTMNRIPLMWSRPSAGYCVEVHLPRYLYEFAGPMQ